jgi:hypothetical protein
MLVINARWLDKSFRRHQHCIEFVKIQGSHSRENLASVVLIALKRHNICYRLLTITSDNALNNNTLCVNLYKLLLCEYNDYLNNFLVCGAIIQFRGNASQIWCFTHVLNLIIKAILKELGSSTYKQATKYLNRAAKAIVNKSRSRL